MASSLCLSASNATPAVSYSLSPPSTSSSSSSTSSNFRHISFRCSLPSMPSLCLRARISTETTGTRLKFRQRLGAAQIVCMAPEEEKMTRRSPLDFPIEWERPKPGRRPDIFPQFSPMKTPLPPPLPADPPEEDEEEEEEEKKEEEEEEDKPEKQQ
ncbi:hypothetical protein Ancab_012138 [Ancistrocladus abbreviatus]